MLLSPQLLLRPINGIAAGGGGSSVAIKDTGSYAYFSGSSRTSASFTGLTATSGANALVVMAMFDQANATAQPSSITAIWDSGGTNQSLTSIVSIGDGSGLGPLAVLFGLTSGSLTLGNKTLALSWTTGSPAFVDAVTLSGVNSTFGSAFPHTASALATTTVAVTSASNHVVIAAAYSGAVLGTISGTTIFSDAVSGTIINAFSNYMPGAGTVNIGTSQAGWNVVATDVSF